MTDSLFKEPVMEDSKIINSAEDSDDIFYEYLDQPSDNNNIVNKIETSFSDELEMYNNKKIWLNNAQEIITKDLKNKSIFSSPELLINEVVNLIQQQKKYNTEISVIDNNIYHLQVNMKGFKNETLVRTLNKLNKEKNINCIEIHIYLHKELYPYYPPTLMFIKPRFDMSIYWKLNNLRMIQLQYWNPARTLEYLINNLREIINNHGEIDIDHELKNKESYLKIETSIVNLFSDSNFDDLDTNEYKPIVPTTFTKSKVQSKSVINKLGIGYGMDSSVEWDTDKYLKVKAEQDEVIKNKITIFVNSLQSDIKNGHEKECYNIIKCSSFLIYMKQQLSGMTLLEINKRLDVYDKIIKILEILANTKRFIKFFFKNSLINDIKSLYEESKIIVSINKSSEESSKDVIANRIINIYDIVNKYSKLYEIKQEKKEKKHIGNDIELKYTETMNKYRLEEFKRSTYGFSYSENKTTKNGHIMREITNIKTNTPINYGSSVFVKFDPSSISSFVALITGPKDTPYDHGCFLFDIQLPTNYPEKPPTVKLTTTGHGTVRFNPNLYQCGKVCLSLLGTWRGDKGESWNPKISTILQVLLSIQSLILVEQPYFNEPGYESSYGNTQGISASKKYNNNIRLYTMKHAILEYLKKPKEEWRIVLNNHFYLKRKDILQTCETWVNDALSMKIEYQNVYNNIKSELQKLKFIN
jgi:ubiquitin-protein ligase